MDFSVLLKDLRDVAEKYQGKTSEPQVSTHAYVDMFTKILKRAEKVTVEYDDQITVLWVALNQLASIYKDLAAGSARDQLCRFIFGMCAKTVLNIQWAQLDEDSKVKNNFCTTVEGVHKILSQQGFQKFQLILDLMESHWTHPVLSKIMSGDEEDTEDCLEYIQKEDPDILKLRIEIMMKENCEEFALNLCTWSLKHPQLLNDLKIKEHQIFMLYKQQEYGKMQEVCETIVCHDGIKVMAHLAKLPSNEELCIRLAQVFLIQDWMRPERTCCTQELLKLWIHHQYQADEDEERFFDSIWTVAKVCRDTEQIGILIDGVRKECGDTFIQLYSELCKYAINIDKGNMEREEVQQDRAEFNKRRLAMSNTCVRMAFMLMEYDFRMARICGLTAFSLDPTTENLNLVNKLYWTIKDASAASQNSKINIATLYEIERLLGQIRPEPLNPEYSWKQLIPLCKKYKIDFENLDISLLMKKEQKSEKLASQGSSSNFTGNKTTSPMPDILTVVKSDKNTTKKIDTGQKKGRNPKQFEVANDIQKTHLTKLLKQKNLSDDQVKMVLRKEFPSKMSKDLNEAPSLDVKELDKTINDLKKSIDLENRYREMFRQNIPTLHQSRKGSEGSVTSSSGVQSQHVSRQEQFRQQQQMFQNKNLTIHRQQSAPGSSQALGPILHRQLSVGSPQPPHAHTHHRQQASPVAALAGSPPPAHSTSPLISSPTGFQSSLSPPGVRPHSASPTILNSRNSGAFSQMLSSQIHSETVNQLYNKIKGEVQQQPSQQSKTMKTSKINILRPPGNSTQECAKIAQQIAEMREKQRAERELSEKLEKARTQGRLDCMKAALNSRNIPSRSQISDLLSLTLQGSKAQKLSDGQKNLSLHSADASNSKCYQRKKSDQPASVSSVGIVPTPHFVKKSSNSMQSSDPVSVQSLSHISQNQSSLRSPSDRSHSSGVIEAVKQLASSKSPNVLVPGKQAWDASIGMLKQKYYYKTTDSASSIGNTGLVESSSLTVKPVYEMIVPKDLINPDRKEELEKAVTNVIKQFPRGLQSQQKTVIFSSPSTVSTPAVVRVQSLSQANKEHTHEITQQQPLSSASVGQLLTSGTMQTNTPGLNSQGNIFSGLAVSSQSLTQNFAEDELLNLNTLAAASISVLGNGSTPQLFGSVQLTEPVQQQQMFVSTGIDSQPMFASVQSVQQVASQQETILATPLYTMPAPVLAEPVLSQQLTGIQPQLDLGQQQVVQQILSVQNQNLALNNTPQLVNVVNQQASFQVSGGEQPINFSGVSQSLPNGIAPSVSAGVTQPASGGISDSKMNGMTFPMTSGVTQSVSSVMTQPTTNMLAGIVSSPAVRPLAQNQFLTAPELSPAIVQQIWASLKRGGTKAKKTAQSKSDSVKKSTAEGQKQAFVLSNAQCSLKQSVRDSVQKLLASRSNPAVRSNLAVKESENEARRKIIELRKQFGQTNAPLPNVPGIASVATSQEVKTSFSSAVPSTRKTGGLLERLMADDADLNKSNLPSFLSPAPSDGNIASVSTVAQEMLPELPDLGAKEFQIDSILALDNVSANGDANALQNDLSKKLNIATGVSAERNKTGERVLKEDTVIENSSTVLQNTYQAKTPIDGPSTRRGYIQSVLPADAKQDKYSSNQSTYYNANRLGKERENRGMKERENEECKNQQSNSGKEMLETSLQEEMKAFCLNCDQFFLTEQHLQNHKLTSKCVSKWQCTFCKMHFKCSEILKSHEKNYCLKAPSAMVKCYNCGVYFQSHEQLKSHLNPKKCSSHSVANDKQTTEQVVCGICERKFDSMNAIKEHVKIGCIKKDSSFSKEKNLKDYNFSVVHKCTKCNFMNLNENIVSKHVEKCKENNTTAHLTNVYQCNMCEETLCNKEDACRHVTRQCPKLKVTNSHKHVQDVYQRLKESNFPLMGLPESDKTSVPKVIHTRKEQELNEGCKTRPQGKERPIQLNAAVTRIDTNTAIGKPAENLVMPCKVKHEELRENSVTLPSGDKKIVTRVTTVVKSCPEDPTCKPSDSDNKVATTHQEDDKDSGLVKTEQAKPDDKVELTAQLQKEQRITAENRFFAEFNEIEKRKQAIRMQKQKELEKQKDLLERKEKEKEWKEEEVHKDLRDQLYKERERQRLPYEKRDTEELEFQSEKRKHMNTILGNVTFEQKMKEKSENQKFMEKSKDVTVKVLSILKIDGKDLKVQNSENFCKNKIEGKQEIKQPSNLNHKSKLMLVNDIDSGLAEGKASLKDDIKKEEIKRNKRDSLKKDKSDSTCGNVKKKQRSPQDIRKMKGLRAKRLIKKQKFFVENFEMGPLRRDKFRKGTCQSDKRTGFVNILRHQSSNTIKSQEKCKNRPKAYRGEEGIAKVKEEMDQEELIQSQKRKAQEAENMEKYRISCRFCDLKSGTESNKTHDVLSHYIKSHNLGFRQVNYNYFCNFCNLKFPSTQTVQVKDHVVQNHSEAVLKRVVAGRYNSKVQVVKKSAHSHIKTRFISRVSAKTSNSCKHLRALELREKCAEKLRMISLTQRNTIIDYSECDGESSNPSIHGSRNSTDTESRDERIRDVSAKISAMSEENQQKCSSTAKESKDGRRIAPRLARHTCMVKDRNMRNNKNTVNKSGIKITEDDSSDTQMLTRSRSGSVSSSSSKSSLIASAKKRKAAIAFSSRSSANKQQKKFGRGEKILLTRSGRAVRRPEIDYDKLTESSGVGSGGDNSELEDFGIRRRKSARVRKLSEKCKALRDTTSETDESSTEEVRTMTTRQSLSKERWEQHKTETDSANTDQEDGSGRSKRIKTDNRSSRRLRRDSEKISKSQSTGSFDRVERINTRQNSKNVEESDSETESNYTDIEHAVKLLGFKRMEKAADRSAESDSESTSVDGLSLKRRKYRLRKRSTNKKYMESESSEEEESQQDEDRHQVDNKSDFDVSKENESGETRLRQSDIYSEGCLDGSIEVAEKPKVVLIGAEEDEDLNVDYGNGNQIPEISTLTADDSQSSFEIPCTEIKKICERSKVVESCELTTKAKTVLVKPEDEFAGLESTPEREIITGNNVSHAHADNSDDSTVQTSESCAFPAIVMDEDEFEFLKSDSLSETVGQKIGKNNRNSLFTSTSNAAFDSEFIRYTETDKNVEHSETDNEFSDEVTSKSENDLTSSFSHEVPPLPEDVPVLPPRDVTQNRDSSKDYSSESRVSEKRKVVKAQKQIETDTEVSDSPVSKEKFKPALKNARVVIEDISVARRALEIENAEKKLKEACKASSCSVRIDRLSVEVIEKHSNIAKENVKEKELDVILVEDSDEESLISDTKPEGIESKRRRKSEGKVQKHQRDRKKGTKDYQNQNDTLIQDIVLDSSIIDELLKSENVTVEEKPVIDSSEEKPVVGENSSECVQIVLENSVSPESLIAVDAQCETIAEEETSKLSAVNNVIILINDNEDDETLNKLHTENESEDRKEIEDEVWVENAESLAETQTNSETCDSVEYKIQETDVSSAVKAEVEPDSVKDMKLVTTLEGDSDEMHQNSDSKMEVETETDKITEGSVSDIFENSDNTFINTTPEQIEGADSKILTKEINPEVSNRIELEDGPVDDSSLHRSSVFGNTLEDSSGEIEKRSLQIPTEIPEKVFDNSSAVMASEESNNQFDKSVESNVNAAGNHFVHENQDILISSDLLNQSVSKKHGEQRNCDEMEKGDPDSGKVEGNVNTEADEQEDSQIKEEIATRNSDVSSEVQEKAVKESARNNLLDYSCGDINSDETFLPVSEITSVFDSVLVKETSHDIQKEKTQEQLDEQQAEQELVAENNSSTFEIPEEQTLVGIKETGEDIERTESMVKEDMTDSDLPLTDSSEKIFTESDINVDKQENENQCNSEEKLVSETDEVCISSTGKKPEDNLYQESLNSHNFNEQFTSDDACQRENMSFLTESSDFIEPGQGAENQTENDSSENRLNTEIDHSELTLDTCHESISERSRTEETAVSSTQTIKDELLHTDENVDTQSDLQRSEESNIQVSAPSLADLLDKSSHKDTSDEANEDAEEYSVIIDKQLTNEKGETTLLMEEQNATQKVESVNNPSEKETAETKKEESSVKVSDTEMLQGTDTENDLQTVRDIATEKDTTVCTEESMEFEQSKDASKIISVDIMFTDTAVNEMSTDLSSSTNERKENTTVTPFEENRSENTVTAGAESDLEREDCLKIYEEIEGVSVPESTDEKTDLLKDIEVSTEMNTATTEVIDTTVKHEVYLPDNTDETTDLLNDTAVSTEMNTATTEVIDMTITHEASVPESTDETTDLLIDTAVSTEMNTATTEVIDTTVTHEVYLPDNTDETTDLLNEAAVSKEMNTATTEGIDTTVTHEISVPDNTDEKRDLLIDTTVSTEMNTATTEGIDTTVSTEMNTATTEGIDTTVTHEVSVPDNTDENTNLLIDTAISTEMNTATTEVIDTTVTHEGKTITSENSVLGSLLLPVQSRSEIESDLEFVDMVGNEKTKTKENSEMFLNDKESTSVSDTNEGGISDKCTYTLSGVGKVETVIFEMETTSVSETEILKLESAHVETTQVVISENNMPYPENVNAVEASETVSSNKEIEIDLQNTEEQDNDIKIQDNFSVNHLYKNECLPGEIRISEGDNKVEISECQTVTEKISENMNLDMGEKNAEDNQQECNLDSNEKEQLSSIHSVLQHENTTENVPESDVVNENIELNDITEKTAVSQANTQGKVFTENLLVTKILETGLSESQEIQCPGISGTDNVSKQEKIPVENPPLDLLGEDTAKAGAVLYEVSPQSSHELYEEKNVETEIKNLPESLDKERNLPVMEEKDEIEDREFIEQTQTDDESAEFSGSERRYEEEISYPKLRLIRQESISSSSEISLISVPENAFMIEVTEANCDLVKLGSDAESVKPVTSLKHGVKNSFEKETSQTEDDFNNFTTLEQVTSSQTSKDESFIENTSTNSITTVGVVNISSSDSTEAVTDENSKLPEMNKDNLHSYGAKGTDEVKPFVIRENELKEKPEIKLHSDSVEEEPSIFSKETHPVLEIGSKLPTKTLSVASEQDISVSDMSGSVSDMTESSENTSLSKENALKQITQQSEIIVYSQDVTRAHENQSTHKDFTDIDNKQPQGEMVDENRSLAVKQIAISGKARDEDLIQKNNREDLMSECSNKKLKAQSICGKMYANENTETFESRITSAIENSGEFNEKEEAKMIKHKTESNYVTMSEEKDLKMLHDIVDSGISDKSLDDLVKENEEKRKVFETPSPRRKGMIVGSTCVMKKPTHPVIETKKVDKAFKGDNRTANQTRSTKGSFGIPDLKINKTLEQTESSLCKEIENKQEKDSTGQHKPELISAATKRINSETNKTKTEIVGVKTSNTPVSITSKEIKITENKNSEGLTTGDKNSTTNIINSAERKLEMTKDTKISSLSSQLGGSNVPETATDKKVVYKEEFTEVQLENETDEEFRRRTETVRSARKKSAVKPYESDFNFEDNEVSKGRSEVTVMPSTSFWPSESDKMENFDTASLYSNSSSGSSGANANGIKEGRSRVMARCARDFGKDELFRQKGAHLPQTSTVPVFTSAPPEKTSFSSMAVKIMKSAGCVVQTLGNNLAEQNVLKYTVPSVKVVDKTQLPPRVVQVSSLKSIPNIPKTISLTSANIDETLRTLTRQGKIGREIETVKVIHVSAAVVEKEKIVKGMTSVEQIGQVPAKEDIEADSEILCKKTKALRAMHKSNKPFKWESSPSPPKQLRSKSKEKGRNTVQEDDQESSKSEKVSKGKPDGKTRDLKKKSGVKAVPTEKKMSLREKLKETEESAKINQSKEDGSEKKRSTTEVKRKRKKEQVDNEKQVRTRSRSGSKDKAKTKEESNSAKQEEEVTVRNKGKDQGSTLMNKQNLDKISAKDESVPDSDVLARKGLVESARSSQRRQSSLESEDARTRAQKRKSETFEGKQVETQVQKSDDTQEPCGSKDSNEEPAPKVCKLDGTSSSPEKNEVSECAHKLNIPGCDHCRKFQQENKKAGMESHRPAVRQIIHKGKVFEIQRGCVTETDIQDLTTKLDLSKEEAVSDGQVQVNTRSRRSEERRKRAHSPEYVVETNMRNRQGTVGVIDINKYISQTLKEIKKQRDSNPSNKWTVRQKKRARDPFPYSFKKAK